MTTEKNQGKQLTIQQKKILQNKQKNNAQVVCAVMVFALGIITSPKLLSFFFQKQRYPQNFQPPSIISYIGCTSGFLFFLAIFTVFLRIVTKKSLPAQYQDPASIKSINQAIKNTIIYTLVFLGLYNYLLQRWTQDTFILKMSPFVLFGFFVFEFLLRLFEFIVGAKGFRYLAHSVILFLLGVLCMECLTTVSN